jgi:hypothetical protein
MGVRTMSITIEDIFWATPAAELEGDLAISACSSCRICFGEFAYYDGRDKHYCEKCAGTLLDEWRADAEAFASQRCEVTRELPAYDPASEFRCSPDDYRQGARESYTENAYDTCCRHGCTNYDQVRRGFDGDYAKDRLFYVFVRERCDELIREHPMYMRDPDEEDLVEEQ